eukprot:GILJ01017499.1.p1 GENE.GILJ01017499.1~~GILJ01017499.1.p1  ORF type:complete len:496 (-),score=31.11 GILJ01017499.1:199-1686(-)
MFPRPSYTEQPEEIQRMQIQYANAPYFNRHSLQNFDWTEKCMMPMSFSSVALLPKMDLYNMHDLASSMAARPKTVTGRDLIYIGSACSHDDISQTDWLTENASRVALFAFLSSPDLNNRCSIWDLIRMLQVRRSCFGNQSTVVQRRSAPFRNSWTFIRTYLRHHLYWWWIKQPMIGWRRDLNRNVGMFHEKLTKFIIFHLGLSSDNPSRDFLGMWNSFFGQDEMDTDLQHFVDTTLRTYRSDPQACLSGWLSLFSTDDDMVECDDLERTYVEINEVNDDDDFDARDDRVDNFKNNLKSLHPTTLFQRYEPLDDVIEGLDKESVLYVTCDESLFSANLECSATDSRLDDYSLKQTFRWIVKNMSAVGYLPDLLSVINTMSSNDQYVQVLRREVSPEKLGRMLRPCWKRMLKLATRRDLNKLSDTTVFEIPFIKNSFQSKCEYLRESLNTLGSERMAREIWNIITWYHGVNTLLKIPDLEPTSERRNARQANNPREF